MANFSGSIPSASSIFSAYASLSASVMLVKTAVNQMVPVPVQNYISTTIQYYFKAKSADITVIVEESDGMSSNELYSAAETYLYSRIDSNIERLKISKRPKQARLSIKFAQAGKMVDFYEGVEIVWRFGCEEKKKGSQVSDDDDDSGNVYSIHEKRYFEISFNKKYKEIVLDSYIPYVLKKSKEIKSGKKVLKLHTLASFPYSSSISWESINLEHPSTFQTVAMDNELKKAIIDDLDRFVRRKDFYRKVGKAWKRGYLLYGPPGTGKSSLIAAMANHLKFDIYDLELAGIKRDSDLRRLLLRTANRSILVIEDIDCTVGLPNREERENSGHQKEERHFTLSGLLNFIDGLWSSCGDERIIIFTTNNKDKLDSALLRPGRMDMHIPMFYLTTDGFRTLATNYLGIQSPHWRFREIEALVGSMNVTPAEVAEELMRNEDPDVSLGELSKFLNLKRKKMEQDDAKADGSRDEDCDGIDDQNPKGKRIKLTNGHDEHLNSCNGV